ncbi:flagellar hook assembly protein FlgD [Dongia deserti]|uniref:flagellar hook assembly protein FlgD n=1 Tax=Dongia deserti TaxID=2268030 RepID=UPI000E65C812|nr:flagellar hook assembly protein FlgD [Dongia deserti]
MEIPNIQNILGQSSASQSSSSSTSKTDEAIAGLNDTYNNFLLLLTKQLQNQDPLDPMDTAQFTQQLVGFSQVEQQIASNKSLEKLIALQSSTNAFGAVSFIGNEVAVDSSHISLKNGKAKFEYQIDRTASSAALTVINERGQVVLVQEANKGIGTYKVEWNGKDAFGNQLPDGSYRVAVSYSDAQGQVYAAPITSFGVVDSTEIKDGEVKLFVGSVGFPIDKVLKVTKPAASASNAT